MANSEHVKVLQQGVREWNRWRKANPRVTPNLSNVDFRTLSLTEIGAEKYRFGHRSGGIDLRGIELENAQIKEAHFGGAILVGANFSGADLTGSDLSHTVLEFANLTDTNLGDAKLANASVAGARIDPKTNLCGVDARGMTISRFTLESLSDVFTRREMFDMRILDDLAELRSLYGGFKRWIHLTLFGIFFAPYAYFLCRMCITSRPMPGGAADDYIPVWKAVLNYVVSGGVEWKYFSMSWVFLLVIFGVAYNTLRVALLWKTKQIEHKQEVSGFPVYFTLEGRWGIACGLTQLCFAINLIIVPIHTWHFLNRVVLLPE